MSGPAVERAAARAAAATAERLAARLREHGAAADTVAGGVAVSGRGLRARHLTDPALRWPAGLLR